MLHEDDFVGILDGAQLEDVVGTFLEACVGHGVRIHAIQVQGHRLVDGDASGDELELLEHTGDELDLAVTRRVDLPDALFVGFFAHGGHVARVRVQYAILTRDDRDMCLLGVEDVLEPRKPEEVAVRANDDRVERLLLEKSLYLLYPVKRSHVIPFQ